MAPAREDRNVALLLAGAVALFLLLVGQAQVTVLDGSSMLAVAQSIVHHASLSVPPVQCGFSQMMVPPMPRPMHMVVMP